MVTEREMRGPGLDIRQVGSRARVISLRATLSEKREKPTKLCVVLSYFVKTGVNISIDF